MEVTREIEQEPGCYGLLWDVAREVYSLIDSDGNVLGRLTGDQAFCRTIAHAFNAQSRIQQIVYRLARLQATVATFQMEITKL